MNNSLRDNRFDFLIELGCSIDCVNGHLKKWNESVINYAADPQTRFLFVENIKYLLSKTQNENLTLYMFFLYTDAFLYGRDEFKREIFINLERTMDRLFGENEGVVALYGKGRKIILKKIEHENK